MCEGDGTQLLTVCTHPSCPAGLSITGFLNIIFPAILIKVNFNLTCPNDLHHAPAMTLLKFLHTATLYSQTVHS